MTDNLESRIQVLEEKYEYQDRTVEMLNQVLIQQQQQIEQLRDELERLKQQMMATTAEKEISQEPPPHY